MASGQRLDDFLEERIFRPLGMTDTAFWAGPAAQPRLAALYRPGRDGEASGWTTSAGRRSGSRACSAGAAAWCPRRPTTTGSPRCCCPRTRSPAGELDGIRLLSPRTVGYMARNHLPGRMDLETFGRPLYAESPFRGVGFGLGFAVLLDPVPGKVIGSAGELSWGGAASTTFWIDQAEA